MSELETVVLVIGTLLLLLLITLCITLFSIHKRIKKLGVEGVGKQGPPGPKGNQNGPCKSNKEESYDVILKDKNNNIVWKGNSIKHKPWADYIEEEE